MFVWILLGVEPVHKYFSRTGVTMSTMTGLELFVIFGIFSSSLSMVHFRQRMGFTTRLYE